MDIGGKREAAASTGTECRSKVKDAGDVRSPVFKWRCAVYFYKAVQML